MRTWITDVEGTPINLALARELSITEIDDENYVYGVCAVFDPSRIDGSVIIFQANDLELCHEFRRRLISGLLFPVSGLSLHQGVSNAT